MNKEEKTETPSVLSKNTTLEKILLIRDRTCDLWFDRKLCAKNSWCSYGLGIGWNTCLCEFYTLWVIYFQLSPMFPTHVHLKAKCWHPALHFRLQGRLPLAQVYGFSKIWCSHEWFIFLYKKHVCLSGGKTRWTVRSCQPLFSEPHECYCLALFMCPPPSSLEPREFIA